MVTILVVSFYIKLVWYFIRHPSGGNRPITLGTKLKQDLLYLVGEQKCMPSLDDWEDWIKKLYEQAFTGDDGSLNYYYFAATMLYRLCYPNGFQRGNKPRKLSSRPPEESAEDKRNSFDEFQRKLGIKFRRRREGKQVYIICVVCDMSMSAFIKDSDDDEDKAGEGDDDEGVEDDEGEEDDGRGGEVDDEGGDRQSSRPQVSNVIRNERQLSGPQVSAEKQRQVTKTIVTKANTSIPVSTSNADKPIEDSGRRSGRGRGDPVIEVVNAQNWYGDVPGDTRKKKVGKVGDDRRPSASSQPLKKPKEATEALSSGPPNISCSCVTKPIVCALLIIFDMADCFLFFTGSKMIGTGSSSSTSSSTSSTAAAAVGAAAAAAAAAAKSSESGFATLASCS